MRKHLPFHLPIALFLFAFSSLGTWYEGSNLLSNPFEWRQSTPFSSVFHDSITSQSDITQLDFFVYASKFYPFFPTLMLLSLLYLITILGACTINDKRKSSLFFTIYSGFILVVLMAILMQHVDTKYYYAAVLLLGLITNLFINYRNNKRLLLTKNIEKT
ncbi:DUF4306 domain-containing protein [Pradoshia sp.]